VDSFGEVTVPDHSAAMRFKTDGSVTPTGFKIRFEAVGEFEAGLLYKVSWMEHCWISE